MININVDIADLKDLLGLEKVVDKAMQEAVTKLTSMVHHKIIELANQKLHSRREMFIEALHKEQIDDDTWLITLEARARWIDDGSQPHDMLADFLKSPKAKIAKDGSKYLTIGFRHGPGVGKTNSTPAQQDLTSTVKAELKSRGIPFGSIEKYASGAAKVGKLHSFNINNAPIKNTFGPGQGHGPIGDVKQGPNQRQLAGGGPGGGGIPFLKGVSVYQTPDAKAKSGVRRDIMTFRIASSKHQGQNRWQHPGNEPTNLMLEGLNLALDEFRSKIEPEIMSKIVADMA
jgi:hypothetical protein